METESACIFTLAALLIGSLMYLCAPYWGVRRVPGPPMIPLLGHLPLLVKHGPEVFNALAKQYGPIFRFHLGRQPLIIIADPELCKEVGIKKFKSITNRSLPSPIAGSPLHQKGLFFTRNSRWSTMRNTIISLYQPSHLASLIPAMQSYIERTVQNLCNTKEEDILFSDLTLRLATDVIGATAFGADFGLSKGPGSLEKTRTEDEISAFIAEHMHSTTSLKMDFSGSFSIIFGLLAPVLQEPFRQLLKRVPGTGDWKIDQTNKKLSKRMDAIVAKRAEEKTGDRTDFLSAIMNARESNETLRKLFTSDYISALTFEHLLAGSATTSFTLSSIIYLVSKHPVVERKILEEIDEFGPRDLVPTADDLQHQFPYTDQVIKEAMRFYTASPLIARVASQQVEVGGCLLPKGTWIWLAPGAIAKDPKYFPDPDVFRPERFDPAGEEEKRRHPYAHIPFGIGPRGCVGQKFSLQVIKLSIIHLYRSFVFRHSPQMESPLEFQYGVVLDFKHGVKLRAIGRASGPCPPRRI